jgi:hypothetical protein
MSSFRRRGVAGPNCVSVSTLMQQPRCFDLAIMQRRRKLVDMHQDNLSSFRPRKGRGCFVTLTDRSRRRSRLRGLVTHPDAVTSGFDALNWI